MGFFNSPVLSNYFLQGDILKKEVGGKVYNAFIVNADCDIFQKKNKRTISYLDVVDVEEYINDTWSFNKAIEIIKKREAEAVSGINRDLNKIDNSFSRVCISEIKKWIIEEGPDSFLNSIKTKRKEVIKFVNAFYFLSTEVDFSYRSLINIVDILESSKKDLLRDLESHLLKGSDFPDIVFIPSFNENDCNGYVVNLRSINTISESDIFLDLSQAMIEGKTESFYRIGRLEDFLRFQIVQKLSFLFTRIGADDFFEKTCKEKVSKDLIGSLDLMEH